jgi:YidC/Oxa1 family membrane protein insertase
VDIILKPFSWLLLFFYETFHSYGLALILFAIVIKLILFPVTLKSKKSMIQTSMLSGKMQQLQKQYGKDRERYNLEVQKLYERENVNPMGGCLWSLIPLVLLMALYAIIREPLVNLMGVPSDMINVVSEITGIANTGSYPQIAMASALNDPAIFEQVKQALGEYGNNLIAMHFSFLGINLSAIPTLKFWVNGFGWGSIGLFLLPLLSTVVSYLSMKVTMATNKINNNQPQSDQMEKTNKMMMWTMPLMSLWIGFTVPAGLSIYWIAQYVINMLQELICAKLLKKDYEAARAAAEERERQEKEAEKQRREEARLERARRIEEEKNNKGKKKNGQKKDAEPEQEGVNKSDSRVGLRAYARGRAYIPNRYGEVTAYTDPDELARAAAAAAAQNKKGRKKAEPEQKAHTEEQDLPAVIPEELPAVIPEEQNLPAEIPTEEKQPAHEEGQTEEIEVEVEQVEVEADQDEDEHKEGV